MTPPVMMAIVVCETKATELKCPSAATPLVTGLLRFQIDVQNGDRRDLFPSMITLAVMAINLKNATTEVEQEWYTELPADGKNGD